MKQLQTRHGVFETNSSSSHSISLDYSPQYLIPDVELTVDGNLEVTCGEFGWGYESYTDFYSKLAYLMTDIFKNYEYNADNGDNADINNDAAREDQNFIAVENCIKKHIPQVNKLVVVPLDDRYYPYGYIDHQSIGVASEAYDDLDAYLFNTRTILIIDNDNH